jgi:hypothetical protein
MGALARNAAGKKVAPASTVPQPASVIRMPKAAQQVDALRIWPIYWIASQSSIDLRLRHVSEHVLDKPRGWRC